MRALAISVVTLVGCRFSTSLTPGGDDVPADASVDAPPASPLVKFTTITSTTTALRPGLYGMEIVATLHNDLPTPITGVAVTLTFGDGTADRAGDFRWRDVDAREGVATLQPQGIKPGEDAVYRFKVDALPWAVPPGPIAINGAATFLDGATPLSATASETPLALPFAAFGTIVVTSLVDENDGDTEVCLREALVQAAGQSGLDRIVFDPAVFPPGAPATALLADSLGEIGVSQDVVIDGHGAGVILAVDNSWENDNRYALKITNGNVVVSGITFKNFAYGYENEDVSSDNCGTSTMHDGGAIRINNGQLVLDGNTFEDPDVGERNCFGASLRIEGGTRHRILNNTWTNQVMDAIYVDAATLEISGNVMNAGADLGKVDECIFIATQGGAPLWITNNICADQEFSAVVAGGTDAGGLFVYHNTFVRNGRSGGSAVQRRGGARAITLRNNVYVNNLPAQIAVDNNGTGFDIAYEASIGSPLISGSSGGAFVNASSNINPVNPLFVDSMGSTRAALTPIDASPLVDAGIDLIDVNGKAPNHITGNFADMGAVER